MEYRFPDQPGNSGVLLHASTPRVMYGIFPQSIEVQLEHGNAGDSWWNTMVIEAVGREIRVWVNGDLVNEGTLTTADHGHIALQSEGPEIEFSTSDTIAGAQAVVFRAFLLSAVAGHSRCES